MSLPALHELFAELSELLADAHAERGLAEALALLAEHGIEPVRDGQAPWLTLEEGGRALALSAEAGPRDLREGLSALLRLALLRIAEQEELRKTKERFDMLSEASFEGILIHVDGVVIDVNQRLAEMAGWEPDELLGADMMRRTIAPEDLEATLARVAGGFEGTYRITAIRKDGTRFPAELQTKQTRFGDRALRVAAVRDITERERTLSLLRQVEQHLKDLALGAFDFMIVTQRGVLVDVGGDFERLLGYTREQLIGRPGLDFVTPAAQALTAQVIAEERPGTYETTLLGANGDHIPVEVMGVRSTLNGRSARVAGFRDLRQQRKAEAERRKLQQQLERSQRLDSLGVLAGGIAHDFNNLLVGVIGNASVLLQTLTNQLDRDAAAAIMSAGQRAASLTRQMLAYAGHQDLGRREPVNLADLLRELRRLLDATLSKKAALSLSLAPSSVVNGDRATITQVLMNLLTNASDALMGEPGKIEVRTSHVRELDARWNDALGAKVGPGRWLLVEVEDNGIGMDEATRLRVFEPFFSTKEHGHGLGLAACLGIVKSHGGALLLESEPGKGSLFSLVLPASELPDSQQPVPVAPSTSNPCRVLVIDDEELVRQHLRRALEMRGYAVDEASDGLSGVARHAQQPADVLLIDMTMPDIDGAEVVRRIRASGSRAAIVLSSGYQAQAAAERLGPGAYQIFLPKPYGLGELVDALEQARARASGLARPSQPPKSR
jgi:two-component system, cell cycle sensor histidine kinase and response regulator CckA